MTFNFIKEYTLQIDPGKIYVHKNFQINMSKNNWVTVFYDKDISTDHKICECCFSNNSASSHPLQPKFSGNDLQHIKKWHANKIVIRMSSSNIKSLLISQHLAIQRSRTFQETSIWILIRMIIIYRCVGLTDYIIQY